MTADNEWTPEELAYLNEMLERNKRIRAEMQYQPLTQEQIVSLQGRQG